MDTFFEQIVPIRKTGKSLAAILGIWLLAFVLTAVIFLILIPLLGSIGILLVFGIFFGAYKLSSFLNIEYEYIITNGTLDVDKITNKSTRKRVLSLELGSVTRLEKYNPSAVSSANAKTVTFACNGNEPNVYLLVAEKEGKGSSFLVFAPDERLQSAIVKFVPKFISNSAFK